MNSHQYISGDKLIKHRKSLARRIGERILRVTSRRKKYLLQSLRSSTNNEKSYVFVVGCQRSGTSMMYKTFEAHPYAAVYDEISKVSNKDQKEGLRLNDLDSVLQEFESNPASIVVAKPLVESHRILELLEKFPNSKAIWLFRNYEDVVNSSINRFGAENSYKDILPMIESRKDDWRSENISEDTMQLLRTYEIADLSTYDAASLFWYARNSLFFDQNLHKNPNVFLCNNENLVKEPEVIIKELYAFLNLEFPGNVIYKKINAKSVGLGQKIDIRPEIRDVCDDMLNKLNLNLRNQHG